MFSKIRSFIEQLRNGTVYQNILSITLIQMPFSNYAKHISQINICILISEYIYIDKFVKFFSNDGDDDNGDDDNGDDDDGN